MSDNALPTFSIDDIPDSLPCDRNILMGEFTAYLRERPELCSGYYIGWYTITYWLIAEGYCAYAGDNMSLRDIKLTPKANAAGFGNTKYYSAEKEKEIETISLSPSAQKLLLDSLNDIGSRGEALKKQHAKEKRTMYNNARKTNAGTPWSEEEIEFLKGQYITSKTVFSIADKLHRSPTSIAIRAVLEGLVEKDELNIKGITDTDKWKNENWKKGT